MKTSKWYLILTAILAVALIQKFYILNLDTSSVSTFRGGQLEAEAWNPLIAAEVNGAMLSVSIDNHVYTNTDDGIYMDQDRNIMVPVTILRDAFNCSAHVYNNTSVLVEKHNYSLMFDLNSDVIKVGSEEVTLSSPLTMRDEKLFVSLKDLSNLLNYTSNFDIHKKVYAANDASNGSSIVPARYDLREKGRVPQIRDQGNLGTCWAFSALSALESSLLPEQNRLFAVDHMVLANSFSGDLYNGGDYTMGMAYLAAWQGPVLADDDPYGDRETDDTLAPQVHVQEMRVIDGKDYEAIKSAVFKYGGVETSIYIALGSPTGSNRFYNSDNSSYCYIGTKASNHGIIIVGWDDNYPKENFNVELEGDGAFICQNSWGSEFGEDGVFYVSYYDTNIGTHNLAFTGIEETDNYAHIYQSDLCGWVGKMGYDMDSIYGANVFTAGGNETVEAAGFYATGPNTSYKLYIVPDFQDETSFANASLVAEGKVEQAGYYTVDFNRSIAVDAGHRYAVMLYIQTPESAHPLAIEYDSGDPALADINLEDGEGYISYNGTQFVNVKEKQDCNLCIKAFTNNR